MRVRYFPRYRAVTLTELLVVLAIISLLATIAVPVYMQKTEQARIAVARQETRSIAEAEQQVFALYGFFVPIHILNNLGDLPQGQTTSNPRDDFKNDSSLQSNFAIDPLDSLATIIQDQAGNSTTGQNWRLTDAARQTNSNDPRVVSMVSNWAGPFLNPQRVAMGTGTLGSLTTGAGGATQAQVSGGLVVDPWGRPYRMYSPLGVVGNIQVSTIPTPTTGDGLFDLHIDDGELTVIDPRFDRWAIVSFGRDGVSDTTLPVATIGANTQNDIFYVFGIVVGESFYKAF